MGEQGMTDKSRVRAWGKRLRPGLMAFCAIVLCAGLCADEAAAQPLLRAAPNAPVVHLAAVDWQGVGSLVRKFRATHGLPHPILAHLSKPEIDKTRLPILFPRIGSQVETNGARLFSFGDAYSLNLPQRPGVTLIMYGHRSLVESARTKLATFKRSRVAGMKEDAVISKTEDGWTASFARFGIAYTLDLSCDDDAMPECRDDGYLRQSVAAFEDVHLGAAAAKEAQASGATL